MEIRLRCAANEFSRSSVCFLATVAKIGSVTNSGSRELFIAKSNLVSVAPGAHGVGSLNADSLSRRCWLKRRSFYSKRHTEAFSSVTYCPCELSMIVDIVLYPDSTSRSDVYCTCCRCFLIHHVTARHWCRIHWTRSLFQFCRRRNDAEKTNVARRRLRNAGHLSYRVIGSFLPRMISVEWLWIWQATVNTVNTIILAHEHNLLLASYHSIFPVPLRCTTIAWFIFTRDLYPAFFSAYTGLVHPAAWTCHAQSDT